MHLSKSPRHLTLRVGILLACLASADTAAIGQSKKGPYTLTPAEEQELRQSREALEQSLVTLRTSISEKNRPLLEDVEVFLKAALWMERYPEEIWDQSMVDRAHRVLAEGRRRAEKLAADEAVWPVARGRLALGYRSVIDASVQPFAVVLPESDPPETGWPLEIVLHGRNGRLSEVSFLDSWLRPTKETATEAEHVELHVFGRTNNAYRWAGEADVFEALGSLRSRYSIDASRILLRGFSMGGAGAWHLGLHYPSVWVGVEAGAGFTETERYANLPDLPRHQRSALHIYDAVDWAENAWSVPIVGYGGEKDKQLAASVNIREALAARGVAFARDGLGWRVEKLPEGIVPGVRALFLVGAGMGHRWDDASRARSREFLESQRGYGMVTPTRVRFVTWTLRYSRCHWVQIEGLGKHYERASIDARYDQGARSLAVELENIVAFSVNPGPLTSARVAGQVVELESLQQGLDKLDFYLDDATWRAHDPRQRKPAALRGLRKRPRLQGPIDDAFTGPFLCVRPTGNSPNSLVEGYARSELDRLETEFPKWLRGDVLVVDDTEVDARDMEKYHLVLFGDPASNSVLKKLLPGLPIEWTQLALGLGGRTFGAANHVPALIYPNPFAPWRYVVVNSGHTFGARDFRGTNALLFPRLGDWAILELGSGGGQVVATKTAAAGFFDESWEPPKSTDARAKPDGTSADD